MSRKDCQMIFFEAYNINDIITISNEQRVFKLRKARGGDTHGMICYRENCAKVEAK